MASNLAPSSRRAVGLAMMISIGNIGGVMGSYMFFDSDAPKYNTGFALSLTFATAAIASAVGAELAFKFGNAQKAKINEDGVRAMYTNDELLLLGDRSPLFQCELSGYMGEVQR